MADDLGGLFDSDPGFLEELASGAGEGPQQSMAGMMSQNSAAMQPNMAMMGNMQQHGGYNMPGMHDNTYSNNVPYQQQQNSQQYNQQGGYNQFGGQGMYNQGVMVSSAGQGIPQGSSHHGQYVSQAGMMQPNQQVMYQQYNSSSMNQSGPRLPTPSQPTMKVSQSGMQSWNQGNQIYGHQQQVPCSAGYMPQTDYGVPNTSTPQLPMQQPSHHQQQYPGPQPQQNNQPMYMQQRLASPTSRANMPSTGAPTQQQIYPRNDITDSQNFQTTSLGQPTRSNGPDPMMMQQQQPYMQTPQQQQSQQQPSTSQYQQYQYRSPPQVIQQPNMADNCVNPQPSMVHYQQTSPNHQQQHRMPFNNMSPMPQSRGNMPMLSPRPTPPPQSPGVASGMLSPTGSTSSHQGSFNMEQSPQPSNNMPIFHQSPVDGDPSQLQQPPQQQPPPPPQQQPTKATKSKKSKKNNASANSNATTVPTFPTNPGPVSPSFKVLSPTSGAAGGGMPPAGGEVQALNQQIQQLYSMPQTPQTQQKLLDLQEKLRLVKSQQMLQTGQLQQQQQPPMQMASQPQQMTVNMQQPLRPSLQSSALASLRVHVETGLSAGSTQQIQLVPSSAGLVPQRILIIQQQQPPVVAQTNGQPLPSQPPTVLTSQQVAVPASLPQPSQQGLNNKLSPSQPTSQPLSHQQQQHIVINSSLTSGGTAQQIVLQPLPHNETVTDAAANTSQQQEKANKIIAEAIAKAQKSGNTAIPRVVEPPELSAQHVDGGINGAAENEEKPKKKRKYTPRKEREKKKKDEAKEKDGEGDGEKPSKPKKKKSKKKKSDESAEDSKVDVETLTEGTEGMDSSMVSEEGKEPVKKKPKKKKKKKEVTDEEGTAEKPEKAETAAKTPKAPSSSKKSKKPPATFLKSRKRKRRGSSDGSDVEIKATPPPSPENEEYKRRSGRHVKRKKYLDDVDLNLSDEDTQIDAAGGGDGPIIKPDQPPEEDNIVVDKVLGSRIRKNDPDDEEETEEVEEFFIKYKNFSYLHCEWKTEAEILDKRIQGKLRRYKMKKMQINNYFDDDEELFNPDYVEVDRVLDESIVKDAQTGEEVTHYLVKWRSLAYEDSTWELQQDVDPEKVKMFKKFRQLPPKEEQKPKPRPKADDWTPLKETHVYKNDNSLREYQLEGVNWLTFSYYKKQNCILADEMGLGKTIQSITFLQELFSYGIKGPFLVVAPLSTIANWQREFETWTDMNVITYHGTSPSRFMLQEYEMYYRDEDGNKITNFFKFHALITTYEIILTDLELLRSFSWRCLIIDEAHRLKNKNCSLIKGLKCFSFEHKVLLSGTPLQNNVEELFSLLNFLEPNQFNSSEAFLAEFGTLRTEEQVDKLKAILKPMMLRRLKEDVEKNIAAKEETIIEVELTNIQKKYYRAILEKNFTFLSKGATSTNVPSLMNTMMELRKCCNHPYLINGAEDNILADLRSREGTEPEHIQALVQASGKFVLLDKLLPKLKQNGHRVLIFSQMIRVLDIIEDYLINKRYPYERLDGRIRGNLRQEAIDRYSKPDSDRFVFLICTKAGGLGINLTAADTVIIYDSDWNPQNDLQAQARCHRIGQNKMVKVYRLITRNSYEREMFDRASMKLGLDKAVLQSGMGGEKLNQQPQLSKREVEELLRKGAYGALMEDDSAGDKFCEEDIDQILKGRTQIIQIESEGKGSTFAKASFSVSSNRDDIDINDPEFWQKWAKKADVDVDSLNKGELIVDEPRQRKKTARYGNNDTIGDISDLGSDSDSNEDGEGSRKAGRKGRRSRRGGGDDDDDFDRDRNRSKSSGGTGYGRSELFKVEKGLLHYGWGRWKDILSHARFKRPMEEKDVENVAKAILLYGLQYYKGDERIKEFIWDLVSKENEDGGLKNHSGLSAPVPRGRKGKKAKNEESHFDAFEEIEKAGIKMDRDIMLNKNAYKRHIHRHSNKVLLRVRSLYYLKQEVLGNVVDQIDQGIHVKDIKNLAAPVADSEPPTFWWDELADKSLLIGVYKHGYEKYNLMRQDPSLIFLERCGPPDTDALAAEMKDDDDNDNEDMDETSMMKDDDDEESLSCPPDGLSTPAKPSPAPTPGPSSEANADNNEEGKLPFPTISEMNTRLRKIITNYQRDFKKQQLKMQQQAKKVEKRERLDAVYREREARRRETLQRWTRREETDFYRVVSTYGIEFDRVKGRYIWDKFRIMAKLDKKTDEQLTEYFISFYHMCLRVCRKIKEDAYPPTPVYIEAITEERANRCIARIDLLSKIREEIIVHPKMESRIKLCQRSLDLPTWWLNGKHDRELLIGAAKHGLARTDYYILADKTLSFHESLLQANKSETNSPANFQLFGKDLEKKEVKSETEDEKPKVVTEDDKETDQVEKEKAESDVKTEAGEGAETKPAIKTEILDSDSGKAEGCQSDTDTLEGGEEVEENASAKEEKSEKEKSAATEEKQPDGEEMEIDDEKADSDTKAKVKDSDAAKDEVSGENNIDQVEDMETEETEKIKSDSDSAGKEDTVKKDNSVKEEKTDSSEGDSAEKKKDKEEETKVKNEEKDDEKYVKKEEEVTKEGSAEPKEDPDDEVREALEGEEGLLPEGISQRLLAQWPKDRVVFHRLEQICYCVETGEWPFPAKMKNIHILGIDSGSNTPTRSLTPANMTPKQDDEISRDRETVEKPKPKEKDFEIADVKTDGLKMTFQKKPEKGRRSLETLEDREKAARIQAILAQSLAASQAANEDSHQDSILSSQVSWPSPWQHTSPPFYMTAQSGSDSPFLNGSGSHMSEEEMLMNRSLIEQGLLFGDRRGRRGRKRKAEKMAEIAMAEALARRQTARAVAAFDKDAHVPVVNLEDGSRLSGDEAPLKKDLETWLERHPGYMVDSRDDELEQGEIAPEYPERRKGRKPKFDPAFLEVEKLTGEENVSVINRLTGKKITGAKAPPLRYLAEWLEQNPMWDVDPKWAELVRAKGTLPKTLLPRVGTPSRRGRRPRDSPLSHSMMTGTDPHQAAALAASIEAMNAAQLMAAGFGKLPMPFGSMHNLGLNPLALGLAGFGFPGLHGSPSMPSDKDSPKHSKDSKGSKEDKGHKDETSSPHPSFPLMFNPLLYNPLLAAQGFGGIPTSLASLGLLNGHSPMEEEPKHSKPSKSSHTHTSSSSTVSSLNQAQDLSVKAKPKAVVENTTAAHSGSKMSASKSTFEGDDMPCDLSMKSKPKTEDKSKQKICSSDKLSRIVDSLKFRVNKMDDKPGKEERDSKRHSLDAVLNLKQTDSDMSGKDSQESEEGAYSSQMLKSLSKKLSSPKSSSSHSSASKEPVPKIVQELLAAKEQKEKEELLIAKQQKLDALLAKQQQLIKESTGKVKQKPVLQGGADADLDDKLEEGCEEKDGKSTAEES